MLNGRLIIGQWNICLRLVVNTFGLSKQIFNRFISRKMPFEKISIDPATGNFANEESVKTTYFSLSFHLKQPYNEGGGLGTCKEYGECYLKAVFFKFIFNVIF